MSGRCNWEFVSLVCDLIRHCFFSSVDLMLVEYNLALASATSEEVNLMFGMYNGAFYSLPSVEVDSMLGR